MTDGERVLFPLIILSLGCTILAAVCALDNPTCAGGYALCIIVYGLALMARTLREPPK